MVSSLLNPSMSGGFNKRKCNSNSVKRCTKCGEEKPLEAFNRNKTTKDGRAYHCKKCQSAYMKTYYPKNRERMNENAKRAMRKKREKVVKYVSDYVSGKKPMCLKCGMDDIRTLQIDHINAGGNSDVRSFASRATYYSHILSLSPIEVKEKYQILCANCNWIKRYENNENSTVGRPRYTHRNL